MKNLSILYLVVLTLTAAKEAEKVKILSRAWWGARAPKTIVYQTRPVEYVIIQHTVTPPCHSEQECTNKVLETQNYHMSTLDFDDIGYNFMITTDGSIYEGVGWHKVGAHTFGYNSRSIGIAFLGDFSTEAPGEKQLEACRALLDLGVELEELDRHYKLLGARQVGATESPGLGLYREIQKWPHWVEVP